MRVRSLEAAFLTNVYVLRLERAKSVRNEREQDEGRQRRNDQVGASPLFDHGGGASS